MSETLSSTTSIKVGVIGVGNAGGQVAMRAHKAGYNTLVINTSVKDLDDAILGPTIPAIKIGDGRGSGKTRENAMALLNERGNEGIKEMMTNPYFKGVADESDIVFVIFSTGGGTGSGIGPYISNLIRRAYKNKLVIAYGILPKVAESVLAQANTIACVDEMAQPANTYMLADLDYYGDLPMETAYDRIADHIVETMNVIRGDYFRMSAAGMADERDLLTCISNPGYLAIHAMHDLVEGNMDGLTLQGKLIESMKNSPACRMQHDLRIMMNLIIANVPEQFHDPLKHGDYSELNAYVGEPKATFSNYAVDPELFTAEVISISTGLTLPMDRIASIRAKVMENKDRYEDRKAPSLAKDVAVASAMGAASSSKDIIMGSKKSTGADLSFLEE